MAVDDGSSYVRLDLVSEPVCGSGGGSDHHLGGNHHLLAVDACSNENQPAVQCGIVGDDPIGAGDWTGTGAGTLPKAGSAHLVNSGLQDDRGKRRA